MPSFPYYSIPLFQPHSFHLFLFIPPFPSLSSHSLASCPSLPTHPSLQLPTFLSCIINANIKNNAVYIILLIGEDIYFALSPTCAKRSITTAQKVHGVSHFCLIFTYPLNTYQDLHWIKTKTSKTMLELGFWVHKLRKTSKKQINLQNDNRLKGH